MQRLRERDALTHRLARRVQFVASAGNLLGALGTVGEGGGDFEVPCASGDGVLESAAKRRRGCLECPDVELLARHGSRSARSGCQSPRTFTLGVFPGGLEAQVRPVRLHVARARCRSFFSNQLHPRALR